MTNGFQMTIPKVRSLINDYLSHRLNHSIKLRPAIDMAKIAGVGKPTVVYRGPFRGFSLPTYAADEEVFFMIPHILERWNGVSDFTVHIHGYLDTANTAKKFKLQLSWNHTMFEGLVPGTFNDLTDETTTGTWAQYQSFTVDFTIDYDIDTPTVILPGCVVACRLRRLAASSDEIAGEVVVAGIDIDYHIDKVGAPL